jgi:hypothetical protein
MKSMSIELFTESMSNYNKLDNKNKLRNNKADLIIVFNKIIEIIDVLSAVRCR